MINLGRLQETEKIVKSGDYFEVDGFYRYFGHVGDEEEKCKIPRVTCFMLFKKGQKATKLGSCPHDIQWKLITSL
ncbi:MAG: hypothetical protein EB829_02265 [Nitrosopumilus sp. H8]|nr:MAG: hypothetical protein EB829_02265 [Nitrosopumilus sp. H8]